MKTDQSVKNKRVIHFNKTILTVLHLPATHSIHNQDGRESMQGLVFTLYPSYKGSV